MKGEVQGPSEKWLRSSKDLVWPGPNPADSTKQINGTGSHLVTHLSGNQLRTFPQYFLLIDSAVITFIGLYYINYDNKDRKCGRSPGNMVMFCWQQYDFVRRCQWMGQTLMPKRQLWCFLWNPQPCSAHQCSQRWAKQWYLPAGMRLRSRFSMCGEASICAWFLFVPWGCPAVAQVHVMLNQA